MAQTHILDLALRLREIIGDRYLPETVALTPTLITAGSQNGETFTAQYLFDRIVDACNSFIKQVLTECQGDAKKVSLILPELILICEHWSIDFKKVDINGVRTKTETVDFKYDSLIALPFSCTIRETNGQAPYTAHIARTQDEYDRRRLSYYNNAEVQDCVCFFYGDHSVEIALGHLQPFEAGSTDPTGIPSEFGKDGFNVRVMGIRYQPRITVGDSNDVLLNQLWDAQILKTAQQIIKAYAPQ